MTKEELDKRIDEIEGFENKLNYLEEWKFEIDMVDTWSHSLSNTYGLICKKINEIKEQKKVENRIRIVKLDDLNMTFEVYKENKKGIFSWQQQGYFNNIQNCMNAVKNYVLLEELNNHTLVEVKEILNKIDSIKVQIIDLTKKPKKK